MEGNAIVIAANAATISGTHGYRIDGDTATLSADLAAVDYEAQRARWALQLWACERPHAGGRLSGTKVAEAGIDLSGTIPGATHHVSAESPVRLPATGRDYAMVLVLASGAANGFEQVHDFANFTDRQRFLAPHLDGLVAYAIERNEVELSVARVFNPRSSENLSGSLALELRARPLGPLGAGESVVLATAALGRVPGQCALEPVRERVAFSAPPDGQWRLVLALLEWTAFGFTERDTCEFEALYQVAHGQPQTAATPEALASCEPQAQPAGGLQAMTSAEPVQSSEEVTAAAHTPASEEVTAAASARTSEHEVTAPAHAVVASETVASSAVMDAEAAGASVPATGEPSDVNGRRLSIQTASVEDLSRIKGLSRKLAREIVKGRPFQSLEELVRVRGIGDKTVRKLRAFLTI